MTEYENNGLSVLPSGEELEKQMRETFLPEDEWMDVDISEALLDFDQELEFPSYTIKVGGVAMAPLTGLCCIAGQAGNGKTMISTLLMATYLGAKIDGFQLMEFGKPNAKVLYIDTEMEKGNTQLVVARVARMTNKTPQQLKENLSVIRLRDVEKCADRWRMIVKAVDTIRPDVIFLDGAIDIMEDFNDNKEAQVVIRKLMKMNDHYGSVMWTVMHQNPGQMKMAGHGGSFLERKCTVCLITVKVCDDEANAIYHFEIKNQKVRSGDIKPISFYCEPFEVAPGRKDVFPVVGTRGGNIYDLSNMRPLLRNLVSGLTLSTRDLKFKIMDRMRLNDAQAVDYINKATEANILTCNEEKTKDGTRVKSRHYTFNSEMENPNMPF